MYSIQKDFGCFPAAHRQPNHPGHCAQIHGHDWRFVATLASEVLDEQGFVFDFGHFSPIKEWLVDMFDHTLLLQKDDPHLDSLCDALADFDLARIKIVNSVSAEGLAKLFYEHLSMWLAATTSLPVKLVSVTVHEDWKNSATYVP